MRDEAFMEFLRINYPYLYDVEILVRKIAERTGHGELSFTLRVAHNQVDRAEFIDASKRFYKLRQNNVLEM